MMYKGQLYRFQWGLTSLEFVFIVESIYILSISDIMIIL